VPVTHIGAPEMITITSSFRTVPSARSVVSTSWIISSVVSTLWTSREDTPQKSPSRRWTSEYGVSAMIGTSGRSCEMSRALNPDWVKATMAFAWSSRAASRTVAIGETVVGFSVIRSHALAMIFLARGACNRRAARRTYGACVIRRDGWEAQRRTSSKFFAMAQGELARTPNARRNTEGVVRSRRDRHERCDIRGPTMADLLGRGPSPHMSQEFEAEMQLLRRRFAEMSSRCSEQIHRALDAYWTVSAEKMAVVEARDEEVDDEEKTLDDLVLRILALRQPVASDLRVLTASFKLVTDLERVSDEAVSIARAAAAGAPPAGMNLQRLKEMASLTEQVFPLATRSFLESDESLAQRVFEADVEISALYRLVVADIIAFAAEHSEAAAKSMSAMNVARCLERIAYHAANIGEGTRFVLRDDDMPR